MDLSEKLEEYGGSLERDNFTSKIRKHWQIPSLAAVFLLALTVRYMPANGMKYLQAVDPYFIFRNAQHLALEGNLPRIDFHRYFPYTSPTYLYNNGDFVIPAVLHSAGFGLFFDTFLEWAQFYPAMMGALSVLTMYFLGKELYGRKTGISAAFFLAVIAGALRRTSAGFFEKEPIGTFFMMTSLLFFTRAWKQESWPNGLLSGLSLGLFTVSWGGSQMLWLLYPVVTGAVLFIDQDIKSLVSSYTPTVLLAGFTASILNPGNFWFTDTLFLANLAVLTGLWARYLVEKLNIIERSRLPYFVPGMAVFGGVMAVLSPLYSDFVASNIIKVFKIADAGSGGVIGGTVAENAPPGADSLMRSLGSGLLSGIGQGTELVGMMVSPWTLMLFSVSFTLTAGVLMAARKYGLTGETVPGRKKAAYIQASFVAVMIALMGLLQTYVFITAVMALLMGSFLYIVVYMLEEDSAYSIGTMLMTGLALGAAMYSYRFSGGLFTSLGLLTFLPAFLAAVSSIVLHYTYSFPEKELEYRWHLIIPLTWIVSNVAVTTVRSRLVFLSTFAVSLGAGHALARIVEKLKVLDYSHVYLVEQERLEQFVPALLVVLTVAATLFSGLTMAQSIRGSPSPSPQIWEPSLDYMSNETPEGSVVMSWWDYGYYFEELGRRPAVADGMNAGYYTSETRAVNMPLADYLNSTASNPQDREFLKKHSVDYLWLDYSMIGKFAAVSQISNRDNSKYEVIARAYTPETLPNSISRDGNQTVATFQGRMGRRTVEIYAPVGFSNTTAELTGPPTVRFSNGLTAKIGCVLTENGRKTYDVDNNLGFCASEDPFYSLERGMAGARSRMVLVPKKIANSTFVKLYIQDGHGVEYAEKIPEASNGYIKMWKVDLREEK